MEQFLISYGKYCKTIDAVSSLSVIYNITLGYNSITLSQSLNIKGENRIGTRGTGLVEHRQYYPSYLRALWTVIQDRECETSM